MTRIEELRIATRKCHDGPTALRLNRELNALLESELARKDAALREIKAENERAIRQFTNVSNNVLKQAYDSALTPARETGETK